MTTMQRRRLALWALLAAGFLLVNFHRTATAVLSEALGATFDTSGTELGLLHSSFFYIYAGLQIPAGLIVDRYGPRRVGAVGLAVMTVGAVGFALAGSFWAAFLGRAVVGLGGSVLYIATLRYCANWFLPEEYATMTGFTIAASGVGGILATRPLAAALSSVGWRASVLAAAAAGGVLAVAVAVVVRDTPERAGYDTVGEAMDAAPLSDVVANTKRVLGEPETWLMGVMLFFVIGTNFAVLGLWGVPYVVDVYGVDVEQASWYVLVGNAGFVLGSPAMGALSDRLDRRTELVVASTVGFTLAYASLVFTPPLFVVGVALFVALFLMGGAAIVYTVGKERHASDVGGTIAGAINSMGYFGAAVLPAVMGAVLDRFWTGETVQGTRVYTDLGYRVAFGIATAAGVVAVLCAVWLHVRESRRASGDSAPVAEEAVD
jgi:sugar phosphate permease